jgi:hypothetical protein
MGAYIAGGQEVETFLQVELACSWRPFGDHSLCMPRIRPIAIRCDIDNISNALLPGVLAY